jgi:hypothetical protein
MLVLQTKKDSVVLKLNGCIGHNTAQCGHVETFFWDRKDTDCANVVARLNLHLMFRRKYILDGIIKEFDDGWKLAKDGKVEQDTWFSSDQKIRLTKPLDVWKHIILVTLEKDPTWRTCIQCRKLYDEGKREWAQIFFVPASSSYCKYHLPEKS